MRLRLGARIVYELSACIHKLSLSLLFSYPPFLVFTRISFYDIALQIIFAFYFKCFFCSQYSSLQRGTVYWHLIYHPFLSLYLHFIYLPFLGAHSFSTLFTSLSCHSFSTLFTSLSFHSISTLFTSLSSHSISTLFTSLSLYLPPFPLTLSHFISLPFLSLYHSISILFTSLSSHSFSTLFTSLYLPLFQRKIEGRKSERKER